MKSRLVSKLSSLTALSLFATLAHGQVGAVGLNSQNTIGNQGIGPSGQGKVDSSSDGRFVVFASDAPNLVAADGNGMQDIFVRDNVLGITTMVSLSSIGTQGNGPSSDPCISSDGRFVAFVTDANNLFPGDANGFADILLHDRAFGTTTRVSYNGAGGPTNGASASPSISANGQFVAFESNASNIVAGDANGAVDIFVRNNIANTNAIASLNFAGVQTPFASFAPSISGDGLKVVFHSVAPMTPADANGMVDVFMRNMVAAGPTTLVSQRTDGGMANQASFDGAISTDGTAVSFTSFANNLSPNDTNGVEDIFVRDFNLSRTTIISDSNAGTPANNGCELSSISDNGRYIAFRSRATNLHPAINVFEDIYFYDRIHGKVILSSSNVGGIEGNLPSFSSTVSGDGRFVNFASVASNLVAGDANGQQDVFTKYIRSASTTVYGVVHFTLTQADPDDYTLTFDIKNPAGVVVQTIPNVSVSPFGYYFFDTLLSGPHRIVVKSSTFLSEADSFVLPTDGEVNFNFTLRNGDTVPDNVVDLTDFIAILVAFNSLADADLATPGNQPSPNWNPAADLNRDGTVDLTDYTSIVVNFNEVGIV
ncbi:MAG: hypothetical protein K8R88_07695 [Armatimonadetes bacterium]|nr:hypothetical protein [Armatimonadota bacterium]